MPNQVQCPNCGGFKVSLKGKETIDRKSGEKVNPGLPLIIAGILFLLCSPLVGVSGGGLTGTIVVAILAIVVIVGGVIQLPKFENADKITRYNFACYLCGYEWNRRTDEPLPPVTVRPDLIAKGEQRLKDERRRQQDPRIRQ